MNGQVLLFSRKVGFKRGDKVLDVGSMDVNGTVRENFLGAGEYVGIDMRPGKCVDRVMKAEEIPQHFTSGYFDIIVCCETLEHVEHWKEALQGIWHALKVDGKLCITTPNREKGRHGYPSDYWRFTLEDYAHIFSGQQILKSEQIYSRGNGVIVKKLNDSLHFNIEPYRIA
jgi:ubiquinone/menaquinone biosynthesis C-methylase UbiE